MMPDNTAETHIARQPLTFKPHLHDEHAVETFLCTMCGEAQPGGEFYRHESGPRAGERFAACKACYGQLRDRKTPRVKGGVKTHKFCKGCGQEKPIDQFTPHSTKIGVFRARCLLCSVRSETRRATARDVRYRCLY